MVNLSAFSAPLRVSILEKAPRQKGTKQIHRKAT
jgi:hypothetical protein